MGFNFIGYPIGAALAGAIASVSIEASILVGAFACVLGVVAAAILIPRRDPGRAATAPAPQGPTASGDLAPPA
jgi:hypothetical protein